jgi:NAD(P)-dependent dehydrogenase (short-subunit alcohol dehydrogenase family)
MRQKNGVLSGKVVCIAGASRGIGRAVAEDMAHLSAKLLLLSRSDQLQPITDSLTPLTEVLAARTDIGRMEDVRQAIETAHNKWGRIDVLINCAAVLGSTGEIWKSDPDEWYDALRVNLIGSYHTMRAVLPHMIAARNGKIINFAGGGAAYGYPKFSAYGCSKAAIVRLTETVSLECEPYNVQVNAVAPGAIETDLLASVRAAGGEVRTVGTMDQAVRLVRFLASPESGTLTGRFIHARDSYSEWPESLPRDQYTLRRIPA